MALELSPESFKVLRTLNISSMKDQVFNFINAYKKRIERCVDRDELLQLERDLDKEVEKLFQDIDVSDENATHDKQRVIAVITQLYSDRMRALDISQSV